MTSTAPQLKTLRKCASCGGHLAWHASQSALICQFCSGKEPFQPPQFVVPEIPLNQGLADDKAYESVDTEEKVEVSCSSCGATTQAESHLAGSSCPFCGSHQLKSTHKLKTLIKPSGVWPFRIEDRKARECFKSWVHGLWFRPNSLRALSQLHSLKGVYIPYWTFDSDVTSHWTAERGDYYYVSVQDSEGNTRQERRVRWTHVAGARDDSYDDVLVCASQGVPRDIADGFQTFETNDVLPYCDEYLYGWIAESYTVSLAQGSEIAHERMEASQKGRCARDVGGDTHRFLVVNNQFYNQTFKHILLPIWVGTYQYQGKSWAFYVNAITGEVRGKAPYSWIKITLLVLLILGLLIGFFGFTDLGRSLLQGSGQRRVRH